jgi:hypothetical protein
MLGALENLLNTRRKIMKKILILFLAFLTNFSVYSYNPFPKFGGIVEIVNKQYVGNNIEFDVIFTNLAKVERYLHSSGIIFKFNTNCFNEPNIMFKNATGTKLYENFDFIAKTAINKSGETFFGTSAYHKYDLPGMQGINNRDNPDSMLFSQAKELLMILPVKTSVLLSHFVVEGLKDKSCADNIEIFLDNSAYPADFSTIIGFLDRMPGDSSWSVAKFLLYHSYNDIPDSLKPSNVEIIKNFNKDIKITPNPVTNEASIQINGFTGTANVEIYTSEGLLINKSSVEFYGADAPLPVDKLSPGWYFLKIYTDNGILLGTKPLVIIK